MQKDLLERIPDGEDRRKIHLRLRPGAGPVTESVDQVREKFLQAVLDGVSQEELEMHRQFLMRLFANTKKAMEGREKV